MLCVQSVSEKTVRYVSLLQSESINYNDALYLITKGNVCDQFQKRLQFIHRLVFYFGFECNIDMHVIKTGVVLISKYDLSTIFTNNPRIYEYTE